MIARDGAWTCQALAKGEGRRYTRSPFAFSRRLINCMPVRQQISSRPKFEQTDAMNLEIPPVPGGNS